MKRSVVQPEAEEHARLEQRVRSGKAAALRIRHTNILLTVDESAGSATLKDTDAASAFGASVRSIESLRKTRRASNGSGRSASRSPRGPARWNDAITNTCVTARPTCS